MDKHVMHNDLNQEIRPGDFCMISDAYGFNGPYIYKEGFHFWNPSGWQLDERIKKGKKPIVQYITTGFARRVVKISDEIAMSGLTGRLSNPKYIKEMIECVEIMKKMLS